jgi:hypothetical protein
MFYISVYKKMYYDNFSHGYNVSPIHLHTLLAVGNFTKVVRVSQTPKEWSPIAESLRNTALEECTSDEQVVLAPRSAEIPAIITYSFQELMFGYAPCSVRLWIWMAILTCMHQQWSGCLRTFQLTLTHFTVATVLSIFDSRRWMSAPFINSEIKNTHYCMLPVLGASAMATLHKRTKNEPHSHHVTGLERKYDQAFAVTPRIKQEHSNTAGIF